MSEKNGVLAITNRIIAEAKALADEQTAQAQSDADSITQQYTDEARENYKTAIDEAAAKAEAIAARTGSQGEMDRRKMLLAARQKCLSDAFDRALTIMRALPGEEKALMMVKSAIRYQTGDAEYIFNAEDQAAAGPLVVETVNAIRKKEALRETLSGPFTAQIKKLMTGGAAKYKTTLSPTVGNFAGGFILKQGDVEINCTFEVLIGGVREELEGETSSILFK